ncbi:MAG: hypothetical protein QM780_15305 [Hyphomicrobium sp.]|uniref:hypothetical protein n=1 Tax=Hyphomicrobium sp. TaxID=82 RepID=UPI0039E26DA1
MRRSQFTIRPSKAFVRVFSFALLAIIGFAEAKEAHRAPPCDVDCVSRDAGYAWGKELGINDPSECGGNSKDFIEGCQAYATKHEDQMAVPDDEQAVEDDEQVKVDGLTVDDNVNVLTGPSADPDSNLPLPSEAPPPGQD